MLTTAVECPKCGAPLRPPAGAGLVLCVYCGSAVRLQPEAATALAAAPVVEETVAAEDMATLKQMLLAGRRDEALAHYVTLTGGSTADAQSAIDSLVKQISFSTLRQQQLSPYGVLLVVLSAILLVGSALGWALGRLNPLVAVALLVFGGLQVFFFGPALLRTLRFLPGRAAPATVLRSVPIGQTKMGGQNVHSMKMLIEVQPAGAASFQAEIMVPVREASLAKAQPGSTLRVKYLAADPPDVIFLSAP